MSLFGTHSRRYITPATPPINNKGSFGSLDITGCSVQLGMQSGDTIDDSGFLLGFEGHTHTHILKSLGREFAGSPINVDPCRNPES